MEPLAATLLAECPCHQATLQGTPITYCLSLQHGPHGEVMDGKEATDSNQGMGSCCYPRTKHQEPLSNSVRLTQQQTPRDCFGCPHPKQTVILSPGLWLSRLSRAPLQEGVLLGVWSNSK